MDYTKETPYVGITTIDLIDPYAYAYTDEYVQYLKHLELPEANRLPKPPWYRKYKRSKKGGKQYEHMMDNYLLFARKDKDMSANIQKLKEKGVILKRTICPQPEKEQDTLMASKVRDFGRYTFVGIVSHIDGDYVEFSEILQSTGRELLNFTLSLSLTKSPLFSELKEGDLVQFVARLCIITTGYVNYMEGVNESTNTYRLKTPKQFKKLNG
jgi:hypothetical protein